jgi:hypothetical protein
MGFFLKSFFAFPGFFVAVQPVRRARASRFMIGAVPIISSYSSVALKGQPMMSFA